MDASRFHTDEGLLDEGLGTTEHLVSDRDDLSVRELVRLGTTEHLVSDRDDLSVRELVRFVQKRTATGQPG